MNGKIIIPQDRKSVNLQMWTMAAEMRDTHCIRLKTSRNDKETAAMQRWWKLCDRFMAIHNRLKKEEIDKWQACLKY